MRSKTDYVTNELTIHTRWLKIVTSPNSQDKENDCLALMRELEAVLRSKLYSASSTSFGERRTSVYSESFKKTSYLLLLSFGFIEQSTGSFLFGSTLFGLIPGISMPVLMIISIAYTVLDAVLFYAFEVSFLKKIFGISDDVTGECLLNETHETQLEVVRNINQLLLHKNTNKWNDHEYRSFCELRDLLNKHLLDKKEAMQGYVQSPINKALEYFIIVFGALSSSADSYFMAKAAILALNVPLASSLGVAIAVCMVLSGLVFYYAMGVTSVRKMVNPDYKSYHSLRKGLTLFEEELETEKKSILHVTNNVVAFKKPFDVQASSLSEQRGLKRVASCPSFSSAS